MEKEKIISRLNIKDYNNELEKILAKKTFPEEAKNLLLSMLYKIEDSYDDYRKTKINVKLKKEILQEITKVIAEKCDEIQIVKPNQSINNQSKKITTYLDERILLYKVIELEDNKFEVEKRYELASKYLEYALINGYIININEIIRDFDGWSWNVYSRNIENIVYNFIYQTILILAGNDFLESWRAGRKNCVELFRRIVEKNSSLEEAEEILTLIFQISIIEYIKENEQERKKIIELQLKLEEQFKEISDKKIYLQKKSEMKKKIGKEIKDIEEIIEDDIKLKKEFIRRNQLLSAEERIFSLSDFVEVLQKQKYELNLELEKYSNMMKPANYVEEKVKISKKLNLLTQIELTDDIEKNQEKFIKKLIGLTYKNLKKQVNEIEDKNKIKETLYKIRYYKFVPINIDEFVKDVKENDNLLASLEKETITKGCNLKALMIFSKDVKENFDIIKRVLNTKVIDLEKVYFEIRKLEEKIIIKIYDENNLELEEEYNYIKEVNVKLNKKIKLFS